MTLEQEIKLQASYAYDDGFSHGLSQGISQGAYDAKVETAKLKKICEFRKTQYNISVGIFSLCRKFSDSCLL